MIRRAFSVVAISLLCSGPSFAQCTQATYYNLHGSKTTNGETFYSFGATAAHPYYQFGTRLRVTNQRNGKSVVVRINDRGPNLDLSKGAFSQIENTYHGVASVCYSKI